MSDRCIGKRYYSHRGVLATGVKYLHSNYHKDSDAESIIVIRESDINSLINTHQNNLFESKNKQNVKLEWMIRGWIATLRSFIPPKEGEAGE